MLDKTPLGKISSYGGDYAPQLLCPLERRAARQGDSAAAGAALTFGGVDAWRAYEVSWLEEGGKPAVRIGEFLFPCDSPCLVESKSLKLYLNSFNQTRFASEAVVTELLQRDLSKAAGAGVAVRLWTPDAFDAVARQRPQGLCLDHLAARVEHYEPHPDYLKLAAPAAAAPGTGGVVEETFYSRLLKTHCPVTGQPDWATLIVHYRGAAIDPAGLLRYIISWRNHRGFHEQCVEEIFGAIAARCAPAHLAVAGLFLRRGGLDINPVRTSVPGAGWLAVVPEWLRGGLEPARAEAARVRCGRQ